MSRESNSSNVFSLSLETHNGSDIPETENIVLLTPGLSVRVKGYTLVPIYRPFCQAFLLAEHGTKKASREAGFLKRKGF